MKYLVFKDKKKRKNCSKNEIIRLFTKSLFLENYNYKYIDFFENKNKKPNFILFLKFRGLFKNVSLNRSFSHIQIKNRCNLTGRARSIIRYYKISRICFRELASYGKLIGVRKSSW
jgi:ribosomal protein S14